MLEWNPSHTIPMDGTKIILLHQCPIHKTEYIDAGSYNPNTQEWEGDIGEYVDTSNHYLGWIPFPDMPKKSHNCLKDLWRCYSVNDLLIVSHIHLKGNYPVNFCPICGEKA